MLSDKTSKALLSVARRSLQSNHHHHIPRRERLLCSSYSNYYSTTTTSWSSLTSSPFFGDHRRRDRFERRHELPRISLQQSLSLQYFSVASNSNNDKEEEQQTLRERYLERQAQGKEAAKKGALSAKDLVQRYGPVFVGTYLSVYVSTVAGIFVCVESGVLDPGVILSMVTSDGEEAAKSTVEMVTEFMEHYAWMKPYASVVARNPEMANLGVAWIATKFTEPIRLGVTVAIVPKIARTFGFAARTPETTEEDDVKEPSSEESSKEEDVVKEPTSSEESSKEESDKTSTPK